MAYQTIQGVRVWGNPDEGALAQAKTCAAYGNVVQTLLMADHHEFSCGASVFGECARGEDGSTADLTRSYQ